MSTVPRRLGKYELQQPLGRGNIGEVWKARDLGLHKDAAIKILHSDLQSDPHFLNRFTSEGNTLVSLTHNNIVKVHEVTIKRSNETRETTAYLAMDYIEGYTLADLLKATSHRGAFPSVSNIIYLFTCLGAAIDYAHQRGIIHGNLKPGNIILNKHNTSQFPAGEPTLADLGLTQIIGNNNGLSTPTYMSPEQAQGLAATKSSDIYALGIILYEICTGVVPFRDESSVAIMTKHINTLPTPPMLINTNIPSALSEVILRAVAKDSVTRYPSASYLASAVADACSNRPSQRIPVPPFPRNDLQLPAASQGRVQSILGVSQPLSNDTPQSYPGINGPMSYPSGPLIAPLAIQSSPQIQSEEKNTINVSETATSIIPEQQANPAANYLFTQQKFGPRSLPGLTNNPTSLPPQSALQANNPLPLPAPYAINNSQPMGPTRQNSLSGIPTTSYVSQQEPVFVQQVLSGSSNKAPERIADIPFPLAPDAQKKRIFDLSTYPTYMIAILLVVLIFVLGGTIGLTFLFNNKGQTTNGNTSGQAFLQDSTLTRGGQLVIQIDNLPTLSSGQSYVAWAVDKDNHAQPLGIIVPESKGKSTFTYQGDSKRTHLLSFMQSVIITREQADAPPAVPGNMIIYRAAYPEDQLKHLKDILYQTPELNNKETAIVSLYETIRSINDKATSIADSIQNTKVYDLARRQATRIVEMIDSSKYATESGDRPQNVPSQINVARGLLTSPTQTGYLEILKQQITDLQKSVPSDSAMFKHAQNVQNAIVDLEEWLQNLRRYSVQLLKAPDLSTQEMADVALQIKKAATDCYTGRIIAPNDTPQPVVGSAGVSHAYTETMQLATLELQKL